MTTSESSATSRVERAPVPTPRGPLSDAVLAALRAGQREAGSSDRDWPAPADDGDAAIALWSLYELHYRGFAGVDDALEWHPALLVVRRDLEHTLEARLRSRYPGHRPGDDLADDLFAFVAALDGPSLAAHVQRDADLHQVMELLRVRSLYHLKEADPTSWVLPRLSWASQAALVELLYDEYGVGDPARHHAHLWAQGMVGCGLSPRHGAYVDEVPWEVLEQNNAMTLFGLHRRLRGAALGHLAAFEATSSLPSRRMAQGLERLGLPPEVVGYYLEHVEADAVHEQLAVRTICGSLLAAEPELIDDVFLGAFTCVDLESRVARAMLERWGVTDDGEGEAA